MLNTWGSADFSHGRSNFSWGEWGKNILVFALKHRKDAIFSKNSKRILFCPAKGGGGIRNTIADAHVEIKG
jgi:hypothetical protein